MRRKVLALLAVAALSASLVAALGTAGLADEPTSTQDTVVWEGNGTTGGVCDSVGEYDDLSPNAGEFAWLFVLTQPFVDGEGNFDATPADVLANVKFKTTTTVARVVIVKEPPGAVHIAVYTTGGDPPALDTVESPWGTYQDPPGKVLSVLTVSHCEQGPPVTTTTAAAPSAVTVTPKFTG